MGTVITVDVRDAVTPATLDAVISWFHRVDEVFSTYRDASVINRISRGEVAEHECGSDVQEVLGLCEEVRRRSGGAFDIRCRGGLDPSGLVKGWSVQRAADMLHAAGARNFFINAGGDIVARGHPGDDRCWRIGIRHPESETHLAAVLAVSDLAVATSGAYERGEHIVDPASGVPPSELLSMTVAGPSLTYADAFATAAYVMGERGALWVADLDGYEALAITRDRRVVCTPGMKALRVDGDRR